MKLNELAPAAGATKNRKRVGRGPGSGTGKTSARGHNGQKSRAGYSRKRGFEGGQMPLQRRLPKRGFKNPFRKSFAVINLNILEALGKDEIKMEDYRGLGIVKDYQDGIKILGDGDLTKAMTIEANQFSKSAQEKIEKAGGKAVTV